MRKSLYHCWIMVLKHWWKEWYHLFWGYDDDDVFKMQVLDEEDTVDQLGRVINLYGATDYHIISEPKFQGEGKMITPENLMRCKELLRKVEVSIDQVESFIREHGYTALTRSNVKSALLRSSMDLSKVLTQIRTPKRKIDSTVGDGQLPADQCMGEKPVHKETDDEIFKRMTNAETRKKYLGDLRNGVPITQLECKRHFIKDGLLYSWEVSDLRDDPFFADEVNMCPHCGFCISPIVMEKDIETSEN